MSVAPEVSIVFAVLFLVIGLLFLLVGLMGVVVLSGVVRGKGLIRCGACAAKISPRAPACPRCGDPRGDAV
jgi:hypothetical protein